MEISISTNGHCSSSKMKPESNELKKVLAASKKRYQGGNIVIIARLKWLVRNKIKLPQDIELPNLCLMIKNGVPIRAFYSSTLTHVIKKQNYYIQILN